MREYDATPFSTALSITMTATNNSLARVIAFLHKRGAHVRHLNWIAPELRDGGHARMTLVAHFDQDRAQNLRTSLEQLVYVLDVRDTHSAGPARSDSAWW